MHKNVGIIRMVWNIRQNKNNLAITRLVEIGMAILSVCAFGKWSRSNYNLFVTPHIPSSLIQIFCWRFGRISLFLLTKHLVKRTQKNKWLPWKSLLHNFMFNLSQELTSRIAKHIPDWMMNDQITNQDLKQVGGCNFLIEI